MAGAVGEWNIPSPSCFCNTERIDGSVRPGARQQGRAQLCGSLQGIGVGAAESEASWREHWTGGARRPGQETQLLLRERGAPFFTSPAGSCELMM